MWRFLNLFRKRQLDERMEEEFRFHLQATVDKLVQGGMTREDAEFEARRQFGSVESAKEAHRDQRGWRWLEEAIADLRYATRLLARYPGFAIVAVLTMALGIGANSAIFSFVNAVFLRAVPYPNGARLADISREIEGQVQGPYHNSRRYLYFRERARSFEQVAAVSRWGGAVNLIVKGEAEQIESCSVSVNFFQTLGVAPFLGRDFEPRDEAGATGRIAILSYGLWQSRFGGKSDILGRSINLGGTLYTVIGVMPPHFVPPFRQADVWTCYRPQAVNDGINTLVFGLLRPGREPRASLARDRGAHAELHPRLPIRTSGIPQGTFGDGDSL